MRFLQNYTQALAEQLRQMFNTLRDRSLLILLASLAFVLILAVQLPVRYQIEVGQEDGFGGDLPVINGFFAAENNDFGNFRWSAERSSIRLYGLGQRAVELRIKIFPIGADLVENGPRELELWDNGQRITALPISYTGGIYRVLLPPPSNGSGDHAVEIRSSTYTPAGDQRAIASPIDRISVIAQAGPTLPDWADIFGWLCVAVLAWLALRRIGFSSKHSLWMLMPLVLLAGIAAWLDAPRFALGLAPALIAFSLAYLLVHLLDTDAHALLALGLLAILAAILAALIAPNLRFGTITPLSLASICALIGVALLIASLVQPGLRRLYHQLAEPMPAHVWRWLLLFAWALFAMRFGGKIYPDSMRGDIGFHSNRYDMTVMGWVIQLSLNRGVEFPYPSAFYLLVSPFSLVDMPQRVLLRLLGVFFDSISPILVYILGVSALGRSRGRFDVPLLAAAIYAFSAACLMTTWWNFSTHIFSQFAHLLLITTLMVLWNALLRYRHQGPFTIGNISSKGQKWLVFVVLVLLQSLLYLGHFGFWMNMSLLGAIGFVALWFAAWRGYGTWSTFWFVTAAFVSGELIAVLLEYTAFTGLFIDQIVATATGGLTGLAGRGAVDRGILWKTLWQYGFHDHFGFFPVPMALIGLWLLARKPKSFDGSWLDWFFGPRFAIILLMAGTFAIGSVFAVLPFVSGSTLSTRWLMFSAWAIALGAAYTAHFLWQYGKAGRWLVILIAAYVLWNTAQMWLLALAWRIRPPEPF